MLKFHSRYESLYDRLSAFLPVLQTTFISEAPAELQNVDVLLTLLPKDDPTFDNDQVAHCACKASIVAQIAEDVFKKISPFVEPGSQDWLTSERSEIEHIIGFLYLSIFEISLDLHFETPEVLLAGIGNVNPGVSTLTSFKNMRKIEALYKVLDQGNG